MASKRAKKLAAKLKFRAKNPEGLNIVQKNAAKMSKVMTWPEKEFKKLLTELGVKFEVQKIVGKKIFDFYIPDNNLLFEVDGDYYHANPLLFKEEDLNRMQTRNLKNDKFKDSLALGLGYKMERVWEYDLKNNYNAVKLRVKKILSK
jgi:very-short-patch-repair endonuclease